MNIQTRPHWALLEIAEQESPASEISLWPTIRAKLILIQSGNRQKRFSDQPGIRIAFGLMTILLAATLIFFFVPTVRAAVESIIQRMGIAFVDTEQFGQNAQVGKAEPVILTPSPSLTLREIQDRISFPLQLPTWVPEGLSYIYRSMLDTKTGQHVDIQYCRSMDLDFKNGCLLLHASYGPGEAPPLLAESKEQSVEVNGQPGIYVHGGWQGDGRGDPMIKLGNLQWDDEADDAYLTWTLGKATYLLEAHNLGLDLDDMLHIARLMKTP
jgi:hypothetical protein